MNDVQNWLESFKHNNNLFNGSSERSEAKSIIFTSGKGGVGKTTLSIKMGLELARSGLRVLVIDGDYNLSNTLVKINYPLSSKFYLLVQNKIKFEEAIVKYDNMHLLAGCNGHLEMLDHELVYDSFIQHICHKYKYQYDFIIIDSSAGVHKQNLNLNAFCDYRIIIINPDKSSITDSYSLIKILKVKYQVANNFILINRGITEKQCFKIFMTINETSAKFLGIQNFFLGGMLEYRDKKNNFDQLIIEKSNHEVNKNFFKVLEKFYERHLLLSRYKNKVRSHSGSRRI